MNDENRYAPPKAPVADRAASDATADGQLIDYGRTVSAGNGTKWISDAWLLFKQQPVKWVVFAVLFVIFSFLPSRVPFGSVALGVVVPVLYGGLMYALDQQRKTSVFQFGHLLAGFNQKAAPLLGLGVLTLVSTLISFTIIAAFAGSDVVIASLTGDAERAAAAVQLGSYWKGLAASLPLSYAFYTLVLFAPALIVLHEVPMVTAMKMSFIGAWRNFVAGLIFMIVLGALIFLSAIPLGLGLLVTMPLAMICFYTAYRDIYIET